MLWYVCVFCVGMFVCLCVFKLDSSMCGMNDKNDYCTFSICVRRTGYIHVRDVSEMIYEGYPSYQCDVIRVIKM